MISNSPMRTAEFDLSPPVRNRDLFQNSQRWYRIGKNLSISVQSRSDLLANPNRIWNGTYRKKTGWSPHFQAPAAQKAARERYWKASADLNTWIPFYILCKNTVFPYLSDLPKKVPKRTNRAWKDDWMDKWLKANFCVFTIVFPEEVIWFGGYSCTKQKMLFRNVPLFFQRSAFFAVKECCSSLDVQRRARGSRLINKGFFEKFDTMF